MVLSFGRIPLDKASDLSLMKVFAEFALYPRNPGILSVRLGAMSAILVPYGEVLAPQPNFRDSERAVPYLKGGTLRASRTMSTYLLAIRMMKKPMTERMAELLVAPIPVPKAPIKGRLSP